MTRICLDTSATRPPTPHRPGPMPHTPSMKRHPRNAVMHAGRRPGGSAALAGRSPDPARDVAVDGGERLLEAFGLTRLAMGRRLRIGAEPRIAPVKPAARSAERMDGEYLRLFLPPFQRAGLAADQQAQSVAAPRRHVARPQCPARSAAQAQADLGVVVRRPPRHHRRERRGHRLELRIPSRNAAGGGRAPRDRTGRHSVRRWRDWCATRFSRHPRPPPAASAPRWRTPPARCAPRQPPRPESAPVPPAPSDNPRSCGSVRTRSRSRPQRRAAPRHRTACLPAACRR